MRQPGEQTFTTRSLQEVDASGDVIFRFALRPREPGGPPERALEDYYRGQLQDLLRVVALTFRGERLLVDGFAFLNDTTTIAPLWPEAAPKIAPPEAPVGAPGGREHGD